MEESVVSCHRRWRPARESRKFLRMHRLQNGCFHDLVAHLFNKRGPVGPVPWSLSQLTFRATSLKERPRRLWFHRIWEQQKRTRPGGRTRPSIDEWKRRVLPGAFVRVRPWDIWIGCGGQIPGEQWLESSMAKCCGPFGGIRAHRVNNLCLLFALLAFGSYSLGVYWWSVCADLIRTLVLPGHPPRPWAVRQGHQHAADGDFAAPWCVSLKVAILWLNFSRSSRSECAGMVGQRYLSQSHIRTFSMVSAIQAAVNLYDTRWY